MIPKVIGQRGDFVRDSNPSPVPVGYEDVDPSAFVVLKRDGQPVMYHKGFYYTRNQNHRSGHGKSWAARMNEVGT